MSHPLLNALYNWANLSVTPTIVIWENQNSPRPNGEFVTLKILNLESLSDVAESTPPGATGNSRKRFNYNITTSVNSYGDNSLTNIQKLIENSSKDLVIKSLRDNSVGYNGPLGSILNISETVQSNYEPRFQCDFQFSYATEQIDFVSWIQRVILTSELTLENNTEYIRTVTINP